MKTLFLGLLVLYSHSLFAINNNTSRCSHLVDRCEYYLCLAKEKNCGPYSYLESFGHRFCKKFEGNFSKRLSLQGQRWVQEVKSCLIDDLENTEEGLNCKEIKSLAIKGHARCYIESGFCELKHREKLRIITPLLGTAFRNSSIRRSGKKILRKCRWIRLY